MNECDVASLDWLGVKLTASAVVMMVVCGFFFEVTKVDGDPSDLNVASAFGIFGFLLVAIIGVLVFIWQ